MAQPPPSPGPETTSPDLSSRPGSVASRPGWRRRPTPRRPSRCASREAHPGSGRSRRPGRQGEAGW